jgi:hypothetical protein
MLILYLSLYKNVISGLSKEVWIHTTFENSIQYLLPHISYRYTMVSISGQHKNFIIRAYCVPAMKSVH